MKFLISDNKLSKQTKQHINLIYQRQTSIIEVFRNWKLLHWKCRDLTNDLILKIEDNQFSGFGTIPYGVSSKMADVGESIFVLGYPLTQTMGDEIKLTDGLISSRTGFQGDIANYQMSAPVQPENSGGS